MSQFTLFLLLVLFVGVSHQICTNDNVFHDIYCWSISTPQDINITSDFCKNQSIPAYHRVILKINDSFIPILESEYFQNFAGCQISNLNIHDSKVKEISPGAFDAFERLEVINLSNNRIKVLKKGMFDRQYNNSLTSWKVFTLILKNNGLEFIEDGALDNLKNLSFLNLNNNSLSAVPAIEKWQKLNSLDLSNNLFEDIQLKHKNLSILKLHKNKLRNFHFSALESPKLSNLDLSFNNLSKLDATENSLEQIFMLNISHNFITTFKITKKLGLLDWSYNELRSLPLDQFRNATRLACLNLSGNNISYIHSDVFLLPMPYLAILDLSNNKLYSLPQGFFNQKGLSWLDVSRNQLRTKDLQQLYRLGNLRTLFLHNNSIDDILVYKLPPNLQKISIHSNKFKSCERMCDIVKQLKSRDVIVDFEHLLYSEVINGDVCHQCPNITNEYLATMLKNLTLENRQEYQSIKGKLNKMVDNQEKLKLLSTVSVELKCIIVLLVFVILLVVIIHRKSIFSCGYNENKSYKSRDQLTTLVRE